MPNPIFNLVNISLKSFNPAAFTTVLNVQSASEERYYLVKSNAELKGSDLTIQGQDCKITEAHITVFQDLKDEEGHGRAAYHLTMDLESDQASFVTRSYFNVFGGYLYTNCRVSRNISADECKDERKGEHKADELVEIPKNDIGSLVSMNQLVKQFQTVIQTIYSLEEMRALKKSGELNTALEMASVVLTANSRIPGYKEQLEAYQAVLAEYIAHLESWYLYSFKPDTGLLEHLYRLKVLVAEKRRKAESREHPMVESVSSEVRVAQTIGALNVIPDEKTAIRTYVHPIEAKAWELIEKHKDICSKLGSFEDPAVYCQAVSEQRKLVKAATQEFKRLLHEVDSAAISKQLWEALLKIVPVFNRAELKIAVEHQHADALELMLAHSPQVLGNATDLLLRAYERRDIKSFETLLKPKVFDGNVNLLLIQACARRRKAEMLALLQAGVSQYYKDLQGFSPLGALTCVPGVPPDLELVKAFLNNCSNPNVDYMQGPAGDACTALTFACQNNWIEAAELYLEYGANPRYIRTGDFYSSLDICAAKGFDKLLKVLLEKSRHPLEEAPARALGASRKFGNKKCERLLLEKIGDRPIAGPALMVLAAGAPLEDKARFDTLEKLETTEAFRELLVQGVKMNEENLLAQNLLSNISAICRSSPVHATRNAAAIRAAAKKVAAATINRTTSGSSDLNQQLLKMFGMP